MNKQLLTLFLGVVVSLKVSAQDKYEKGYIINDAGEKIEGSIKNPDWKNTPSQIEFRGDASSSAKSYSIVNIKEFEIEGKAKYVKAEVDVDMSSDDMSSLSDMETPAFTKKVVFLKTIVEGKHTLYRYNNENVSRFFYMSDGKIVPLVYKRYLISDSKIAKNNTYINQLQSFSDCESITSSQISNVEYNESGLKKLFIKLNTCGNESAGYKSFDQKTNRKFFHLSVRPGINFSSLDINNKAANNVFDSDYGRKTTFRIGIEGEFVLPLNNDRWTIIAEPTYQYFKSDKKEVFTTTILGEKVSNTASVKYSSIEIPVGVRYYAVLNNTSKLFFNASAIFDIPMGDSKVTYNIHRFVTEEYKIDSGINLGFGVGYKYNNKYSAEFNIRTKRDLLKGGQNDATYQTFSIILGYTLF
ncbi:outer membrane beta-barrel protein [Chryseobacterium jejuense]|nr:outer membrane beta-barrel protein [Chryseobacterium jejuense]